MYKAFYLRSKTLNIFTIGKILVFVRKIFAIRLDVCEDVLPKDVMEILFYLHYSTITLSTAILINIAL